jgi:hypothetical protein
MDIVFTPLSNPKIKSLEYPFSFIENDILAYIPSEFSRGFPDEEPIEVNEFPKNIVEYYWIKEGENDGDDWSCLCKLDNGAYAYYNASCDYTGFDCQGGMLLFVSRNKEKLFNEGMPEYAQRECLKMKKKELRRDMKMKTS